MARPSRLVVRGRLYLAFQRQAVLVSRSEHLQSAGHTHACAQGGSVCMGLHRCPQLCNPAPSQAPAAPCPACRPPARGGGGWAWSGRWSGGPLQLEAAPPPPRTSAFSTTPSALSATPIVDPGGGITVFATGGPGWSLASSASSPSPSPSSALKKRLRPGAAAPAPASPGGRARAGIIVVSRSSPGDAAAVRMGLANLAAGLAFWSSSRPCGRRRSSSSSSTEVGWGGGAGVASQRRRAAPCTPGS